MERNVDMEVAMGLFRTFRTAQVVMKYFFPSLLVKFRFPFQQKQAFAMR
jgi:hypothetical protein